MTSIDVQDAADIERNLAAFAGQPNGGVIATTSARVQLYRASIIAQTAQLRLPAIYPFRHYVIDGGLMSYGPNPDDAYRHAAGYVDRILKGEKPAEDEFIE